MSGSHPRGGPVNGIAQILMANRRIAFALPHPSETWARSEAPKVVAENIHKLLAHHVVEVAEPRATDHDGHRYRTRAAPYEWAQNNLEPPTLTPCGHTGVRNLGDGAYTCQDPDCDYRFGRGDAREVLRG